jgi:hypothetical protein
MTDNVTPPSVHYHPDGSFWILESNGDMFEPYMICNLKEAPLTFFAKRLNELPERFLRDKVLMKTIQQKAVHWYTSNIWLIRRQAVIKDEIKE